jgi:hypothetical protein
MERAPGTHGSAGQDVTADIERNDWSLEKVREQHGNVYENKGSFFLRQE